MDLERDVRRALAERGVSLGEALDVREETGSTNDDAKAAARAGAPHGAVFVADRQTRGRGRLGRAWFAAPGESLAFSVLLRPRAPLERLPGLALLVGLAVAAAVERAGGALRVQLKWPNDVWLEGRKVGGILVEALTQGERVAVIVGVGVNVGVRGFPAELEALATSLALEGASADRAALLADVLAELEARLPRFEAEGLVPWAAELAARDALAGRPVDVEGVRGTARGIESSGALLVETPGGVVPVVAGEARLA